jgi:hypothetical protein
MNAFESLLEEGAAEEFYPTGEQIAQVGEYKTFSPSEVFQASVGDNVHYSSLPMNPEMDAYYSGSGGYFQGEARPEPLDYRTELLGSGSRDHVYTPREDVWKAHTDVDTMVDSANKLAYKTGEKLHDMVPNAPWWWKHRKAVAFGLGTAYVANKSRYRGEK